MMKIRTFVVAAVVAIIACAGPAFAQHSNWSGGGWHGGGGWHRGGGWSGWHGRGWYGGPFGFGGYVGPGWAYPYPVDPYAYSDLYPTPYPYPYPPPVAPAVTPPPQPTQYYCRPSGAYYPAVTACPEPWVQTSAQPLQ